MSCDEQTEEWRPIPQYEGRYEVSNHGRVRSLLNTQGNLNYPEPKILKPYTVSRQRFQAVTLSLDGVQRKLPIYKLVLETFIGPCPEGCSVYRQDGDPLNNRLDNLQWLTRAEKIKRNLDP